MMQIDRSNYEVWFTDWLDGNLNRLQVEQLMLFLDQNKDLREEFNDITPLNLVSSAISYRHKEDLKKSPSDISATQLDYLCAAYLENDLTDSQQKELKEIVNADPDRKKRFDLIQKTILAPERISYKHKNHLLRQTTLQKVIRLSVIALSTAAAISLIIIIYSVFPGTTTLKPNSSAHNLASDSTLQRPSGIMAAVSKAYFLPPAPQGGYRKIPTLSKSPLGVPPVPIAIGTYREAIGIGVNPSGGTFKKPSSEDSSIKIIENHKIAIEKVPVYTQVYLRKRVVSNTLIASNQINNIPDNEDKRRPVGKFISKTFREKLLKDKTPYDTPLKGFEIAEAGVAGLNKLFGWQIALDMKNDDNGQPKSVYFSSKILKVNAPVKKREVQP